MFPCLYYEMFFVKFFIDILHFFHFLLTFYVNLFVNFLVKCFIKHLMISDNFQQILILQELKKLNETVAVFKEHIETYNAQTVALMDNYNISFKAKASDEGGTGGDPVINQCLARQDHRGGLTDEKVKKLINSVENITSLHNTSFHKAFVKNYKLLLRHYQTTGSVRVTPTQNKGLSAWLTNMKTALRLYYTLSSGRLADDPRYIKYMSAVGIKYEE
jgi:hypothetical protein